MTTPTPQEQPAQHPYGPQQHEPDPTGFYGRRSPSPQDEAQPGQPPSGPYRPMGNVPGLPDKPPRPPAPTDVVTAFQLWAAIVLLGVVTAVLMTVMLIQDSDTLAQEWLRQMAQLDPEANPDEQQANLMANIAIGIAGLVMVGFAGLVQLFAVLMRRGRNWARVILTGLAAALVVIAIPTLFSAGATPNTLAFAASAIGIVHGVLAAGALVLMHRAESNAYFRPGSVRQEQ